MSFLVVNCGTSSVKMTLFKEEKNLFKIQREGTFKHLFSPQATLEMEGKKVLAAPPSSYAEAIEAICAYFAKEGFVSSQLKAVGHRVVHGGEKYVQAIVLTPSIEKDLQDLSSLAPLHNPPSLEAIDCCRKLFPTVSSIAAFDTAFHTTLPPKAAFYPLPWELSQKHKIRRYGFHGIAHAFSWKRYAETQGKEKKRRKVITVHLGSGCSLAAIDAGVSIDTSMGFTPLDGVMMATRCGELDPAIVGYLCEKEKKTPDEILSLLNHQAGLLGISQKTADMQTILKEAAGDTQVHLALEMFLYHIQKKIGAFLAVLQGADALLFSGGIGEGSPLIRQRLCQAFSWHGVEVDERKNEKVTSLQAGEITSLNLPNSKMALYVVGCDENGFIAEQMRDLLKA